MFLSSMALIACHENGYDKKNYTIIIGHYRHSEALLQLTRALGSFVTITSLPKNLDTIIIVHM